MADFKDAFKQGLDAAEKAEIARKEVDNVFAELDQQMREASDGKIGIHRQEYYVPEPGALVLPYFISGKKRETYLSITAYNPNVANSDKQLAKWNQNRTGYPCKIVFDESEWYCADRESLETALAELLRNPIVGEKLSSLLILEQPQATVELTESGQQSDIA
jgi:hypothetical protein